jgi:hypothetical protein
LEQFEEAELKVQKRMEKFEVERARSVEVSGRSFY